MFVISRQPDGFPRATIMLDLRTDGLLVRPRVVPCSLGSSFVDLKSLLTRAKFASPLFGQAVISVSNLAVGLLLAREAPKDQYGSFVLAFSVTLFLAGVQDSLVTSPVAVRAAGLRGSGRARMFGMHARSSLAAWVFVLVPLAFMIQAWAWVSGADGLAALALAVSGASATWMAWDFQRASALSTGNYGRLLRSDTTYLVVLVTVLACVWAVGDLSARIALFCIASATAVAWVAASGQFPRIRDLRRVRRLAKMWWSIGRWSLFAGQVGWLQSQNYIYVTSALLGLTALAKVAAARLLFSPLATFLTAWARSFLPIAARIAAQGDQRRLSALLRMSSLYLVALVLVWMGGIVVFIRWLESNVFSGKYTDLTWLAVAWGIVFIANYLRTIWQTGLKASGAFKEIFRWSSVGATVSLVLTVGGVAIWGEIGAVLGLAVGEFSLAFAFWAISRSRYCDTQGPARR